MRYGAHYNDLLGLMGLDDECAGMRVECAVRSGLQVIGCVRKWTKLTGHKRRIVERTSAVDEDTFGRN